MSPLIAVTMMVLSRNEEASDSDSDDVGERGHGEQEDDENSHSAGESPPPSPWLGCEVEEADGPSPGMSSPTGDCGESSTRRPVHVHGLPARDAGSTTSVEIGRTRVGFSPTLGNAVSRGGALVRREQAGEWTDLGMGDTSAKTKSGGGVQPKTSSLTTILEGGAGNPQDNGARRVQARLCFEGTRPQDKGMGVDDVLGNEAGRHTTLDARSKSPKQTDAKDSVQDGRGSPHLRDDASGQLANHVGLPQILLAVPIRSEITPTTEVLGRDGTGATGVSVCGDGPHTAATKMLQVHEDATQPAEELRLDGERIRGRGRPVVHGRGGGLHHASNGVSADTLPGDPTGMAKGSVLTPETSRLHWVDLGAGDATTTSNSEQVRPVQGDGEEILEKLDHEGNFLLNDKRESESLRNSDIDDGRNEMCKPSSNRIENRIANRVSPKQPGLFDESPNSEEIDEFIQEIDESDLGRQLELDEVRPSDDHLVCRCFGVPVGRTGYFTDEMGVIRFGRFLFEGGDPNTTPQHPREDGVRQDEHGDRREVSSPRDSPETGGDRDGDGQCGRDDGLQQTKNLKHGAQHETPATDEVHGRKVHSDKVEVGVGRFHGKRTGYRPTFTNSVEVVGVPFEEGRVPVFNEQFWNGIGKYHRPLLRGFNKDDRERSIEVMAKMFALAGCLQQELVASREQTDQSEGLSICIPPSETPTESGDTPDRGESREDAHIDAVSNQPGVVPDDHEVRSEQTVGSTTTAIHFDTPGGPIDLHGGTPSLDTDWDSYIDYTRSSRGFLGESISDWRKQFVWNSGTVFVSQSQVCSQ